MMPDTFFDSEIWIIGLGYGFELGHLVFLQSYLTKNKAILPLAYVREARLCS